MNKDDKKKIIDLYSQGMVLGLIAKELKLPKPDVKKVLNSHGSLSSLERYGKKKKVNIVKRRYATESIKLNDSKNTIITVRKSMGKRKKKAIVDRYMEILNK